MSRSCGRSCNSSSGLARKVDTSMILPPRKKMWASRNRRPIRRELRKVSFTWLGCALVATSKSFGRIRSSRSRTQPPTRYAWCPARRSRRTTFTASGSRSSSGISGGALALGETLCASVDNRCVRSLNRPQASMGRPARRPLLLASGRAVALRDPRGRGSPRRPRHPAAPEDVQVQVEDDLVRVAACVDHRAPTRLVQALLVGDLRREGENGRHHRAVAHLVERGEVPLRDHQDVHGHLRLDVRERDGALVLAQFLRGDLACHDLAEDAVVHEGLHKNIRRNRQMYSLKTWSLSRLRRPRSSRLQWPRLERFPGVEQQGYGAFVHDPDLHGGAEDAFRHLHSALARQLAEPRIERLSNLRPRGIDESGPGSLARIPEQRELRDRQDPSAHVEHGPVHLSLLILEDPQADDLVRHPPRVLLGIPLPDADQDTKACSDGPAHLAPDRHGRFTHSLHHCPHEAAISKPRGGRLI